MIFSLKVIIDESQHLVLEKYLGIISPILLIVIFVIDRLIASRESKKDRKMNWYSSIIIQPNLRTINLFFTEYSNEVKRIFSIRKNSSLSSGESSTLSKAKEFNKLSILIKGFEFDFLVLLTSYNINLYSTLLYEIISNLNDCIIEQLDKEDLKDDQLENLLLEIKNSKYNFFNTLSQEIAVNH